MEDKFIDAIVVHTQKERLEEHPGRQSLFLTVTMTWLSGSIALLQEEGCSSRRVLWGVLGNMVQVALDVNTWP